MKGGLPWEKLRKEGGGGGGMEGGGACPPGGGTGRGLPQEGGGWGVEDEEALTGGRDRRGGRGMKGRWGPCMGLNIG